MKREGERKDETIKELHKQVAELEKLYKQELANSRGIETLMANDIKVVKAQEKQRIADMEKKADEQRNRYEELQYSLAKYRKHSAMFDQAEQNDDRVTKAMSGCAQAS